MSRFFVLQYINVILLADGLLMQINIPTLFLGYKDGKPIGLAHVPLTQHYTQNYYLISAMVISVVLRMRHKSGLCSGLTIPPQQNLID